MKKWDVLLIGSGISCLTAAALLAKKGKSVCVLEQYLKPGGYLHCFNRFGLRFDTGSHYVGAMDPGKTFHTLLDYMGVYDSELFVELDPEGFDVFRFPEFEVSIPKGYAAVVQRLADQFPSEKQAIARYFSIIAEIVQQFPTYVFRPDFDDKVVAKAMETSVKSVVESLTQNRGLQACLYTYCTIHGVMPQDMAIGLHALVTDSVISGSYGFKKGGDALTQKFVQVIEEAGGKVLTKARVDQLEVRDKSVVSVRLSDGQTLFGETVISGIHPKSTFRLLEPCELKPAFLMRLKKLKESEGIFGIYGYATERPPLDSNKNYYFFNSEIPEEFLGTTGPDSPPGAVFMTRTHRIEEHPTKFPLTFHSAGPMNWFGDWRGTQFNKRPPAYHERKKQVASQVFKLVDRYCPGLSDSIEAFESSTVLSNLHFNGSEEGSAYGIYHSMDNTGWRAIGPRTHINNLYLTGQSTLSPGLLGAAISGLRSAGHVIGIKPLLKELAAHRGNL